MSVEDTRQMKRKSQWGFSGICNCGKHHIFKISDFNMEKSKRNEYLTFKQPFTCDVCNITFYKLDNKEKKVDSILGYAVISIFTLSILFGGYKIISPFFDFSAHNSPTSIDDMTNKQYDEFMKWQDEQDKNKWENQKVGDNN